MKRKTSITLSDKLLVELDQVVGKGGNRSELIERAIGLYLQQLARNRRDKRELEILNREARHLNREAADVLLYQVEP
jgi:metal-responsive CopG/Arc/MetJ family transcriptional regulator